MRILGGTLRGRRVAGPAGSETRPTAGRVKEALFNILADRISGARFLDLYAGTGLIGLEALSRGASHATFVESHAPSCRLLRKNLIGCGYDTRADVRVITASRFLTQADKAAYDIAFVDPPYHCAQEELLLPTLGTGAIIAPNGVVVIEHFHKVRLPAQIGRLARVKFYRYGDTLLSLYRCTPVEASA